MTVFDTFFTDRLAAGDPDISRAINDENGSQAAISMGNLVPTMTQRQATGRDSSTIAASVQALLLTVPAQFPELHGVFEASDGVRRGRRRGSPCQQRGLFTDQVHF